MHYQCDKCRWNGTWDALILETLCPVCRSGVSPRDPEDGEPSLAESGVVPGVVPGPPPRC